MGKNVLRGLLLCDFNASNAGGYLENDEEPPRVEVVATPFGQVSPLLLDSGAAAWQAGADFAVVWTRPSAISPAFQRLLACEPAAAADLAADVDAFCEAILQASERVGTMLVPTWVLDPGHRGLGIGDLRAGTGLAAALLRMNLQLADNLEQASNVFVLDASRWTGLAGSQAFAPKLWYQAKVPFGHGVFQEAVRDIKAGLRALNGDARKLIVLDLDDTLWGGVVGEVGWESLRLGGHDPLGEAFADFQRELKALTRRGILLGLASKNDESVALAAIEAHPDMVLRADDFAGWRITWGDKAASVVELAAELNVGLQSVVFIDDHPVERARVREALPEVLVPEWPESPMLFPGALRRLRCFDTPRLSLEDAVRTQAYRSERARSGLRREVASLDAWLRQLQLQVTVEPLHAGNLPRTAQLLNKTNQMNLRTRRLSERALEQWSRMPGHHLWVFRVADRFGDSGLTGIAGFALDGRTARLSDFVLSCRVMGRRVEETMTHWLVVQAAWAGAAELVAEYLATPKNGPCLEYWARSGFTRDGHRFRWTTATEYPLPDGVQLIAPEYNIHAAGA